MLKEVKIEVTEQCNRMCIHCSSKAQSKDFDVMDIDTVKRIIREAREMGARTAVFTGGEATLYPHLEEVISYATKRGMKSKLYTMADPTDDTIELIKRLTFYGLGEMIYSTTYRLTRDSMVNLERLSSFLPELLKKTDVSLGFHHAVTKDTVSDIESSLNLFLSLPLDRTTHFSLLRYVPHGRGDKSLLLSEEESEKLREKIIEWKVRCGDKLRIGSPWNYLGITNTPCTAADETIIVGFDGSTYPCDAMKYFNYLGSGGNIYELSLRNIYYSPYFESVRKYKDSANEDCMKCKRFSICRSGCLGQKMVSYVDTSQITFETYGNQAIRTMRNFETEELKKMNGELGLIGEIGEFIDSFKKYKTHGVSDESKEKLRKNLVIEAGDVLWYLAASLGNSYGLTFEEVGEYLSNRRRDSRTIVESDIEKCSLMQDPECMLKKRTNSIPISYIDTLIDPNYNFDIEWKKLISLACQIIYANNKEEVLERISLFLISLTSIIHNELGVSIEEAARLNIEKLKDRYVEGFNTSIADSRVTLLTTYKEQEVKDKQKHI